MATVSPHLIWSCIRETSSFIKKNSGVTFATEPNNLKNKHTFKYNGLIHHKTVGVEPAADGKGVVLITKRVKGVRRKPNKWYVRRELKKDARRTMRTINNVLGKGAYRKDLKTAAMRRACAILRSQKPVMVKKPRTKRN
ncbi:large ribosomal subunit protein eL28-like [Amphiura filiformis]|uniref:large ribosomal subunit protein eL28-like n=1 Tax=Amphiura filiformis TaxID=82378 RepID=UPI003B2152FC